MASLKYVSADPNLQLVTLGADYTAGDGHMHLTTGHGARLPSTGDFWLRTPVTGTLQNVFKCTARSTDQITVTAVTGYGADQNLSTGTELSWSLTGEGLDQLKDDITKYRQIISGLALQYDPTPDTVQTEDDEFNGDSLDAKWTVVVNTASSVDYNSTWKSHIRVKFTDNQAYQIKQSYAPTGAFSLTARGTISVIGNYQGFYIEAMDSDDSDGMRIWCGYSSSPSISLDSIDTGVYTSRKSNFLNYTSRSNFMHPVYVHIQRDGSNNWIGAISFDGLSFLRAGSGGTTAYSKTVTIDHIRLGLDQGGATTPMICGIDWIRRDWITL